MQKLSIANHFLVLLSLFVIFQVMSLTLLSNPCWATESADEDNAVSEEEVESPKKEQKKTYIIHDKTSRWFLYNGRFGRTSEHCYFMDIYGELTGKSSITKTVEGAKSIDMRVHVDCMKKKIFFSHITVYNDEGEIIKESKKRLAEITPGRGDITEMVYSTFCVYKTSHKKNADKMDIEKEINAPSHELGK